MKIRIEIQIDGKLDSVFEFERKQTATTLSKLNKWTKLVVERIQLRLSTITKS